MLNFLFRIDPMACTEVQAGYFFCVFILDGRSGMYYCIARFIKCILLTAYNVLFILFKLVKTENN